jgi:hypothetical protein
VRLEVRILSRFKLLPPALLRLLLLLMPLLLPLLRVVMHRLETCPIHPAIWSTHVSTVGVLATQKRLAEPRVLEPQRVEEPTHPGDAPRPEPLGPRRGARVALGPARIRIAGWCTGRQGCGVAALH